jgi:hypothetical protein
MLELKSPRLIAVAFVMLVALAAALSTPALFGNSSTLQRAPAQSLWTGIPQVDALSPSWAQPASSSVKELAAGRTCRCSCGYPCKTNADCGLGGVCAPGISCCSSPNQKPDLLAENASCGTVPAHKLW